MCTQRKTYVISDLHLGDGGPRDNFAVGTRRQDIMAFLDMVASEKARLIINGDLFEFWQMAVGQVLMTNIDILNKMAAVEASFIVGNHDNDLEALIETNMLTNILNHPFLQRMTRPFSEEIGGKVFHFSHGHEVDPFNKSDNPGKGRALSILAGIVEDAHGGPFLDEAGEKSIEEVLATLGELVLWAYHRLIGLWGARVRGAKFDGGATPRQKPSLIKQHFRDIKKQKCEIGASTIVVGHTHQAGFIGDWYLNCGSWSEKLNDVLCIHGDGTITFHHFTEGRLHDLERGEDLSKLMG